MKSRTGSSRLAWFCSIPASRSLSDARRSANWFLSARNSSSVSTLVQITFFEPALFGVELDQFFADFAGGGLGHLPVMLLPRAEPFEHPVGILGRKGHGPQGLCDGRVISSSRT